MFEFRSKYILLLKAKNADLNTDKNAGTETIQPNRSGYKDILMDNVTENTTPHYKKVPLENLSTENQHEQEFNAGTFVKDDLSNLNRDNDDVKLKINDGVDTSVNDSTVKKKKKKK